MNKWYYDYISISKTIVLCENSNTKMFSISVLCIAICWFNCIIGYKLLHSVLLKVELKIQCIMYSE